MYREISPKKLLALRGDAPRREIEKLSKGALSEVNILHYENGLHKPTKQKILALMKVYGVSYEDITEPVELR